MLNYIKRACSDYHWAVISRLQHRDNYTHGEIVAFEIGKAYG